MPQLEVTMDCLNGRLLLRHAHDVPESVRTSFARLLGRPEEVACATPATIVPMPSAAPAHATGAPNVRLEGYWHNSLIEGPGRRSVAKFQGCPIRCTGCITPDSWKPAGGSLVPVDRLADALLDPSYQRDGSILGGEPFFQPHGLFALVDALQGRGCAHIVVYSGYRHERLSLVAQRDASIEAVLNRIDVLIDGPYIAAMAASAGPWTGSGNQRVIDLGATRRRYRTTSAAM